MEKPNNKTSGFPSDIFYTLSAGQSPVLLIFNDRANLSLTTLSEPAAQRTWISIFELKPVALRFASGEAQITVRQDTTCAFPIMDTSAFVMVSLPGQNSWYPWTEKDGLPCGSGEVDRRRTQK
jgi:hypothetical protein